MNRGRSSSTGLVATAWETCVEKFFYTPPAVPDQLLDVLDEEPLFSIYIVQEAGK